MVILKYKGVEYNNLKISEDGRIFNNKRELKTSTSSNGRLGIVIKPKDLDYKPIFISVHLANYESHKGSFDSSKFHVHHIDKNPLNNHIENLMLLTIDEHIEIHKNDIVKGYEHKNSKLTKEDVDFIRKNYIQRHPEFGREPLAKMFKVSLGTIKNVLSKK
ncbi:MAG: HNH endonuclease [Cetobacterium sp.]|uniref:HNH endonuclease n=1 Tax=Cetobacterium sp. TaxID=2071632 RepID=UPI003F2FB93F